MPAAQKARKVIGRPTQAAAAALHERILDVALREFLEAGFAATIEGIAAAAGVSRRTIYLRYPTKDALFTAVLDRQMHGRQGDERARARLCLTPDMPLSDAMRATGRLLLRSGFMPDALRMQRLLLLEGHRFPTFARILLDAVMVDFADPLQAYFAALQASAGLAPVDTRAAAELFVRVVSMEVNRYVLLQLPNPTEAEIDTFIGTVTDLLIQGLRPESSESGR